MSLGCFIRKKKKKDFQVVCENHEHIFIKIISWTVLTSKNLEILVFLQIVLPTLPPNRFS